MKSSSSTREPLIRRCLVPNCVLTNLIYVFRLNEIALSFNGGKDCTVLLHLLKIKIEE